LRDNIIIHQYTSCWCGLKKMFLMHKSKLEGLVAPAFGHCWSWNSNVDEQGGMNRSNQPLESGYSKPSQKSGLDQKMGTQKTKKTWSIIQR
jgi:glycogen synthase